MPLTIDDLILQIKTQKVIPIIGYDLFFRDNNSEPKTDFLKEVIKIHSRNPELETNYPKAKTGNDLINAYYHDLNLDPNTFKIGLSQTLQRERLNLKLVPDSFRKLVSIKHFKFFVNATFTNALELAVNGFRARGMNEEEIKSSYNILNFHPVNPDDIDEAAPERFGITFPVPLIYNLFGTHDEERGDYILTDADYIELIYDLIQIKQKKFANLLSYLKGGYLLFLGCSFPDWFFRFFMRICVGDRLDISPITRKAVVDSLNQMDSLDSSRSVFIGHYKIEALDIDCNELIDQIYSAFANEPDRPGLLENSKNNRVFISYCRGDEAVAKNIAAQFSKRHIEYFLDLEELQTGDQLSHEIKNAIDTSCIFIPIVSKSLQSASDYIWREWNYAVGLEGKKIWPYFQDFVDADMLTKPSFAIDSRVKEMILNKNVTIGIRTNEEDIISEPILRRIKDTQYLSRVSGKKQLSPSLTN